ncbi:TetR/AcrR family transcriptional regulator [Kutzneria buriramensis]|uniref:AcrR family transcriptional regulator n=1 Tax=Kutzneria buriramensis TaxID=1045776 RepID=A0A3E0GVD7_9PSEU|nr:TetR/AcrR family transcriptional regulator [Kutzneria buriramensis]REH27626.1 AcrR family transcriptional regulator [Kutzneria buriramensis]
MSVTDSERLPVADGAKRRRGTALQHAIFDAVFDLINEIGYARLTMERVALAAGTSKAVLYRRWPDKEALVLDALRESLPTIPEVSVHGNLRDDLLAVLEVVRSAFAMTKGTAFHLVAAEAGGDCRALANERVFAPAHDAILATMRRAAERGETRPELVTDLVADIGTALLRSRAIDGEIPPETLVTAIVDDVLLPLLSSAR